MSKINRQEAIERALGALYDMKSVALGSGAYAIDSNIEFFEAARSIWRYIGWALFKAPGLDPKRLLEINDLLPEYDSEMHRELIRMEKKKFPGLIEPLVKNLVKHIIEIDRPMIIASLGSGGMEAERQVIERLKAAGHKQRIIFVGVDQSVGAHDIAKKNLSSLGSEVKQYDVSTLLPNFVDEVRAKPEQFSIIHCQNDIFDLDKTFPPAFFDAVFHTLFKHHLNDDQKVELDKVLAKVAKTVFEYDGYRSFFQIIPQTVVSWYNPILMNGSVFSGLRFNNKRMLETGNIVSMLFFKTAHYLLTKKVL